MVQRVARSSSNGVAGAGSTPPGGASALSELSDVQLTSLSDAQMLAYNLGLGKWVNVAPPTGGTSYFAGLGIDITGSTISTKRQAAGGIDADTNGLLIKRPLDSGLVLSSSGLAVGGGDGIMVAGATVEVAPAEIIDSALGLYVTAGNNIGIKLASP